MSVSRFLIFLGKLVVGLALGVVLSLGVGEGATRLLVDSGLERFSGEERAVAERALASARGCADEPGDRFLRRKFQVAEVTLLAGECRGGSNYRVELRAYTIYARPVGMVTATCEDVYCLGQAPVGR